MLLLPVLMVMIATLLIVCKLKKARSASMVTDNKISRSKDNSGSNEKELQRRKRERDMTLSLLCLAMGFMVNMGTASILVVLGTGGYVSGAVSGILLSAV